MIFDALVAAAGGLVIGWLLWRVADLQLAGRSLRAAPACPQCGLSLGGLAHLPLGDFTSGGRCPSCGASSSRQRGYWELAVAAYVGSLAWQLDLGRTFAESLLMAIPLLLLLLEDLRARVLYMNNVYLALALGFGVALLDSPSDIGSAALGLLIGLAVGALFLGLSRWIFRSLRLPVFSFGLSDVYLAAAVGAIVRSDDVVRALFIALVAFGVGLIVVPLVLPVARRQALPFGPFLCLGGLLVLAL